MLKYHGWKSLLPSLIGLRNRSRLGSDGLRRGNWPQLTLSVFGVKRSENSIPTKPFLFFAGPAITRNHRTHQSHGPVWLNNSDGSKRQRNVDDIIQAAAELQTLCQSHGWAFCFIGGVALQRWSEPRETVDVDLPLFAGFGHEQEFSDVLLKQYVFRRRLNCAEDLRDVGRIGWMSNGLSFGRQANSTGNTSASNFNLSQN